MPEFNRSLPCLLLLALVAAPSAHAAGPTFEITPFGGYRMGGQFDVQETDDGKSPSADLQDGGSWGVDLGLYRDPNSYYELLFSTQSTEVDNNDPTLAGIDVTVDYYQFGGTLLFADEKWMVPYFSFTAGATMFSADGGYDSDTRFSFSAGGGVRLPFTDNVAATLGVRGYLTFVETDGQYFCASTGEQAGCLLKSSGSTFFQGEATLGLTLRF